MYTKLKLKVYEFKTKLQKQIRANKQLQRKKIMNESEQVNEYCHKKGNRISESDPG